ncbi:MAG: hypothetical protein ACM3ZO_10045 [Clostridia bacterium]
MRAVITEAELKRLAPASRVLVPRGAIVTPAARDYARDNGIALIEMAGEGVFGVSRGGNEDEARAFVFAAVARTLPGTLSRAGRCPPGAEGRFLVCGAHPSAETNAGARLQPDMGVQEVMERIVRAAIANLGPHATRETLVKVLTTVLIRLGYAVAVSNITSQDR